MAMDGVDYANALRDLQRDYKHRLHKYNENLQKDLERAQNLHDHERAKLSENHQTVQKDQARDYSKQIVDIGVDATEKVRQKQVSYRRDLEEAKDKFNEDRKEQRREFDKKLDLITRSFSESIKNLKEQNVLEKDNAESRYNEKLAHQRRENERLLARVTEDQLQRVKDANISAKRRREELVKKQVEELNDLTKVYNLRELEKSEGHRKQLAALQEANKQEVAHIRKQEDMARNRLLKNQAETMGNLSESLAKTAERNREKAKASNRRITENFQRRINDINENNRKLVMDKDRLIRSLKNRTSDADGMQAAYNESLQEDFDKRNRAREEHVGEMRSKFEQLNDKNQESFTEALKDQKEVLTQKVRQKEKDFSRTLQEINLAQGRERDKMIEDFNEQIGEERKIKKETLSKMKESHRKSLNNLTRSYAENLRRSNEDHKGQFTAFQSSSNREKAKAIGDAQKQAAKFVADERLQMRKARARDLTNFENDLQNVKNEKAMGEALLQDRLQKLSNRSRMDLNYITQINAEQKEIANQMAKAELESQDADFKIEKQQIQTRNQSRVNSMARRFRRAMAGLKNDYETKIKQMQLDFQKRESQKDNQFRIEQNKMIKARELELATRESQFKNKIEKMVSSYEKELDKYKNALAESNIKKENNA